MEALNTTNMPSQNQKKTISKMSKTKNQSGAAELDLKHTQKVSINENFTDKHNRLCHIIVKKKHKRDVLATNQSKTSPNLPFRLSS